MSVSKWKILNHKIVLNHLRILGIATLLVDDEQVFTRGITFPDFGFAHRFEIEGIPCVVIARGHSFFFYKYDLLTGELTDSVLESNSLPSERSRVVPFIFGLICGGLVAWASFLVFMILRVVASL